MQLFEFLQYDFMKNALLAVLIITPLFGMLGTLIVNHRMAFFSDALGHSAFTGMAIGILFGIGNTSVSMMLFAVVFALLLNYIRHKNIVSSDTVISVFSSLSVAVGLAILSRNGNFSKYSALLVGDILSITGKEIISLLIIFVVLWVVFVIIHLYHLAIVLLPVFILKILFYFSNFCVFLPTNHAPQLLIRQGFSLVNRQIAQT